MIRQVLRKWAVKQSIKKKSTRSTYFRPSFEALEERSMLNAGGLDPTFGSGGITQISFGLTDRLYASALQPDRKIIAVGEASGELFGITRLNSDGSPDDSFGTNGQVTTGFGTDDTGFARGVAVQADGKIVVVGYYGHGFPSHIAVAQYDPNGDLDPTFGNGGKVTTTIGTSDVGNSVEIQSDGKIVLAGGTDGKFALIRYDSDGTLDSTFGAGGIVVENVAQSDLGGNTLAIEKDGKIVALSPGNSDFAVLRFSSDGTLDTTFNGSGELLDPFPGFDLASARGVVIQPDGKIVVAGTATTFAQNSVAMARYLADGSLDTSFSGTGHLAMNFSGGFDAANSVALQNNGDIVITGIYGIANANGSEILLARSLPNGLLDPDFGTNGLVVSDFTPLASDTAHSVLIQRDGNILVSGTATEGTDSNFGLARFLAGLTVSPMTFHLTEGDVLSGPVASFTDADANASLATFSATIDWGDGTTSSGLISQDGSVFTVTGTHQFLDEGTYSITVTVTDVDNNISQTISPAVVLDNDALSATGYNLAGTEGNEINGIVATFTDLTYPTNSPGDFTANINWGDGTNSTGTITSQGNLFVVRGNHTYSEKGSYSVSVGIQDDGSGVAAANTTSTATIADASLVATGTSVNTVEGQLFIHQVVATFTDDNPNSTGSDFSATIDWGNGTTTLGYIDSIGNGRFEVFFTRPFIFKEVGATPIYPEEGHFTITTTIKDIDGSQAIVTSTATVADAPLSATGTPVHAVEGIAFSGQVATFTDANPNAPLFDFIGPSPQAGDSPSLFLLGAIINWGDGTTNSGSIAQPGGVGTQFVVNGHHTYAKAGSYTISVTIGDIGGSTTSTTTTATVTDPTEIVGRVGENGQIWTGVSTGSSFNSSLWASWNPAVTWVDVITGDFNGDGLTDIAGRDLSTGNWWVGVSNGSSFTTSLWTTWNPNVTWVDVQVGDFTGDGKADIAGRVLDTGQWWVAQSTGSSFTNSLWTTWNPMATWVDVKIGDFNGDGKADIIGRYSQAGQWWAAISNGSTFSNSLWATWNPAAKWVDVQVGDFDGDGKADIIGRVLDAGTWWTGISTGSSLMTSLWGMWSPNVTWVDVKVGDFNGDGSSDIIGRVLETGQWWVGLSNQVPLPPGFFHPLPAFATTLWSTWSTGVTWVDVQVGDFNGDGKSDITGRALQSGQWWTGISNGSAFTTSLWATWSTAVNWVDVRSGDFA